MPTAPPSGGAGSSPRVRGKRRGSYRVIPTGGLIPARAGKTSSGRLAPSCVWAHPRACGENYKNLTLVELEEGSSPRVRGKRPGVGGPRPRGGLIPACAGKTWRVLTGTWLLRAHPRVCGENIPGESVPHAHAGSSPRVRGKRRGLRPQIRGRGLIPARAGKTMTRDSPPVSSPAHPRACGENGPEEDQHERLRGLIPARAGKTTGGGGTPPPGGLIPACAGKTQVPDCAVAGEGAHPRACGENSTRSRHPARASGSSPRVRGKLEEQGQDDAVRGLIPARAGKTHCELNRTRGGAAHPRACGENTATIPKCPQIAGSSPRVRGKPGMTAHAIAWRRLIPARAGKTGARSAPRTKRSAHPRACGENAPTRG